MFDRLKGGVKKTFSSVTAVGHDAKEKISNKFSKKKKSTISVDAPVEESYSPVEVDEYEEPRAVRESYPSFSLDTIDLELEIMSALNKYERTHPPQIRSDPRMRGLHTDMWWASVNIDGPYYGEYKLTVFITNEQDDFKYYNLPMPNSKASPRLSAGESYLGMTRTTGILGNMAARRLTRKAGGYFYPRKQFFNSSKDELGIEFNIHKQGYGDYWGKAEKRLSPKVRFWSIAQNKYIAMDRFRFKNDEEYSQNIFDIVDSAVFKAIGSAEYGDTAKVTRNGRGI